MGDIIKSFVKRFLPVFIGLGFMLLVILISGVRVSSAKDALTAQQRELNNLQNKIDIKQSTASSAEKRLLMDSTGLDTDRVNTDNEIATNLISTIFTWSNSEEYDNNRLTMMNDYGVAEDSDMLTVLFPPDVKVMQGDGSMLSYIDTHELNSQFEKIDTYVSGIELGTYSYFAFVTWSSADAMGNEAKSTAVLTYDIDSDGNVLNIMGYTIAS